jgi:DNA-binding MarR family transcriptional regulator
MVVRASTAQMLPTDSPHPLLSGHELASWRGMLEAHAEVTRRLDSQMRSEHGLSLSAYEVLKLLDDAPAHRIRMSELARGVLLSRSGCTRLVDRLVRRGYVSRSADTHDGRGLFAELTATGLERVAAARATHHDGIRRFFLDRLTPTDQIALADIWSRLRSSGASPTL